jgi:hypothetical protein
MSDIRRRGLEYLRKKLGTQPIQLVSVSRFYPADRSWTQKPVWWLDLPIRKIEENKNGYYYLLGAIDDKKLSFIIVKVPNKFLLNNLKHFDTRYQGIIRLHLGADNENWLIDERGKVESFSSFQIKNC